MKNLGFMKTISLSEIAEYIAKESDRDPEVLLFGLRLLLSCSIGYSALILAAALLGVLPFAFAAALTASVARVFMGGAHASSPLRCNILGCGVFLAAGLLAKTTSLPCHVLVPVVAGVGLYVIYRYVPAEAPGKPIRSMAQRKYLRVLSFALVSIWGLAALLSACYLDNWGDKIVFSSLLGMVWQLLSLTPAGYRVVEAVDKSLQPERRCIN